MISISSTQVAWAWVEISKSQKPTQWFVGMTVIWGNEALGNSQGSNNNPNALENWGGPSRSFWVCFMGQIIYLYICTYSCQQGKFYSILFDIRISNYFIGQIIAGAFFATNNNKKRKQTIYWFWALKSIHFNLAENSTVKIL